MEYVLSSNNSKAHFQQALQFYNDPGSALHAQLLEDIEVLDSLMPQPNVPRILVRLFNTSKYYFAPLALNVTRCVITFALYISLGNSHRCFLPRL